MKNILLLFLFLMTKNILNAKYVWSWDNYFSVFTRLFKNREISNNWRFSKVFLLFWKNGHFLSIFFFSRIVLAIFLHLLLRKKLASQNFLRIFHFVSIIFFLGKWLDIFWEVGTFFVDKSATFCQQKNVRKIWKIFCYCIT